MNSKAYQRMIIEVYSDRKRDVLEAAAHLQVEAGELAELFLKRKWYKRKFNDNDLLSEAGDVLNFLTYILSYHDLTLEDAMDSNIYKLKERGWLK